MASVDAWGKKHCHVIEMCLLLNVLAALVNWTKRVGYTGDKAFAGVENNGYGRLLVSVSLSVADADSFNNLGVSTYPIRQRQRSMDNLPSTSEDLLKLRYIVPHGFG